MKLFVIAKINEFSSNTCHSVERSYSLEGTLTHNYNKSSITFKRDNYTLEVLDAVKIFELANQIRGCDYDNVIPILKKAEIKFDYSISLLEKDLIKSLFNIFLWTEYCLLETEDVDLNEQIFDEFIIDYTGKQGSQRDLYFIQQFYQTTENESTLADLYQLGVLWKVQFVINKGPFLNYFIPFSKNNLNIDASSKAKILFEKLKRDRDSRIKNFFDNRI